MWQAKATSHPREKEAFACWGQEMSCADFRIGSFIIHCDGDGFKSKKRTGDEEYPI